MVYIARTLSQNCDVHKCFKDYTVEIGGRDVGSYDDIRTWCKTSLQDSTAQYAFYEIMYGAWERTPGWDLAMEKEFMIQAGNMLKQLRRNAGVKGTLLLAVLRAIFRK